MGSGHYIIESDRTGFPLIRKEDWDYAISLFPVSKYQFERFMVEKGPQDELYTDDWYRKRLEANPRRPWKQCDQKPWELFMTGVRHEEITLFLQYLGKGFRLPKVEEWEGLLEHAAEIQSIRAELQERCQGQCAAPACLWLERGLFPLVTEGLLETVLAGDQVRYLGRPYQGLHRNLFNPGTVRQIHWDLLNKAVGFRVVRTGE